MWRNSVSLLQELRSWTAPKVKSFSLSPPLPKPFPWWWLQSSCWRQSLVQEQLLGCLQLSALAGRHWSPSAVPAAAKSSGGFSRALHAWDQPWEEQGSPSASPASTKFNSARGISSWGTFGVSNSFVIDDSALRFFCFIGSSFQKSERLWGFRININWVMCQWGLAQPQPIIFPGVYIGQECQKTLVQHCCVLVMASWLELGLGMSCAWEKLQNWTDFELSFPLNCSNPPTPLPKYS